MTPVTVDVAGGAMGGAARFRLELYRYLTETERPDVHVVGGNQRVGPAWLVRREFLQSPQAKRVALNNVSYISPGGRRWTLLGNALHFLTAREESNLHPALRRLVALQAPIVRAAAKRSDVLIAPCTTMAGRIATALPDVSSRVVVRMHPISKEEIGAAGDSNNILCPVIFEPYKHMSEWVVEWLAAVEGVIEPKVKLLVTAGEHEVPGLIQRSNHIKLLGRMSHAELRDLWATSKSIFFPPGLESFGFPLGEARAYGRAVIAQNTEQNREIAGSALVGFTSGNRSSLRDATLLSLATEIKADPAPFDPTNYFDWMLNKDL